MSIRRGPRPETRFYVLDKNISEDGQLSWAARGMLVYLLGKPDHWEVSVQHLINQTQNAVGKSSSRDAVRSIIKELAEVGYLKADPVRNDAGAFNGISYIVSEVPNLAAPPETDNPAPAEPKDPETENPLPDEPQAGNPQVVKNDLHQGLRNPPNTDIPAAQNCASAAGEGGQENDDSKGLPAVLPEQQQEGENDTETQFQAKCRFTWQSYGEAYYRRYGTYPIRNAKVNSLIKQLVQRLGLEAPDVADYYVQNVNEAYVVRNTHDLGSLLAKAESYHTQWITGRSMTNTRARQIDQTQANASAADEAIAMLRAKREREAANGHDR